uniref:Uncharacterized protein n=1 Tax=Romanomermis culicivorax TaxID=13658 RepID=A0A915KU16_ROMCU
MLMNKADDLSSEFEFDSQEVDRKRRRLDLTTKDDKKQAIDDRTTHEVVWNKYACPDAGSTVDLYSLAFREDRKQKFLAIDPYSRHKLLVNEYLLNQPGSTGILKRDTGGRLAKRYYDKLFKEYCISDLSRYKENQIAMRWRTEQEVVSGKGQFVCGNKKCSLEGQLTSWEVNFSYVEDQQKKNALVKLHRHIASKSVFHGIFFLWADMLQAKIC